eukprot:TRINITY_DN8169_c0_g1_i1.p1 TRINITY_DN8169_c0_g1~~TRINITY_DN8169_c0_g1_i1.p1  ORF type:complete len:949 (+),score=251.68 TRINITY_DN8169_c0_g1_i1:83-2929(+)
MAGKVVLGVDVGGTNTDCAVVQIPSGKLLGKHKATTTPDVTSGIATGIQAAMRDAGVDAGAVEYLSIGTTHFVNAVVQRAPELAKVVVLRCCGPASRGLPPCESFPADLKALVYHSHAFLPGGFEVDGRDICEFEEDEVRNQVVAALKGPAADGVAQVVVSGPFSTVNPAHEKQVAAMVKSAFPEMDVTMSHQLATVGLMERENSAVLNAAIRPLANRTIEGFEKAAAGLGLQCRLYLTQNDGTLMTADDARSHPVFTFSSGPTNSMRGAAFLTKVQDAVVVDIGGTTTDVGVLARGFPRPCAAETYVGGVRTNFRIPDVLSVGLGGGSRVSLAGGGCELGPQSVGYRLTEEALCFGGSVVTATDVAVAARGLGVLGNAPKAKAVTADQVGGAEALGLAAQAIQRMVAEAVDTVKTSQEPVPVLMVGGGTVILPPDFQVPGCSRVSFPEHCEVANAVGAAIAQVSGRVDTVLSMKGKDKTAVEAEVREQARQRAVAAGARPDSVAIREFDRFPIPYLEGENVRIVTTAVGDMGVFSMDIFGGEAAAAEPETGDEGKFDAPSGQVQGMEGGGDPVKTINLGPDGAWQLSVQDIEYIASGAGVLGTGGGGNAYYGCLRAKACLARGESIRVVDPASVKGQDQVFCVAMMGAPTVALEKLCSGTEIAGAIGAQRAVYQPAEGTTAYLMSCEAGGMNALEPLIAGAKAGLAVVDADLMGRAFPKLDMALPLINQAMVPIPAAIADDKGNAVIMQSVASAKALEEILRACTTAMGSSTGLALAPLPGNKVPGNVVPYSITKCWLIGKAMAEARRAKADPVAAAADAAQGRLLFRGKVTDVVRKTDGAFNKGVLTIVGLPHDPEYAGRAVKIDIQNENMVVRQSDGKVLAATPDLISVLDTLTGANVFTEDERYGMRVSVLAMPISALMRTPAALKACGPRAFGYNVDYVAAAK